MSSGLGVLARAARVIRHDVEFGQEHGDAAFLLAVADWLEWLEPFNRFGDDNAYVVGRGIAVARAYLGEATE